MSSSEPNPSATPATPNHPRWRRLISWTRQHPWRTATLSLLAGFLVLNVLAYRHAHAMLTFTAATTRTQSPQLLSAWAKLEVPTCGVSVPRPQVTKLPEAVGLPYETIHFATDDGFELEGWLIAPDQPRGTVLLLHGYATSRSSLLEQARAFYELGYAAVLVDFRGSGGSSGNSTSLGYDEACDVAAAVQYVRSRNLPGPLILYGQSMGGAAVLRSVAVFDVRPDAIIVESVFGQMLATVRNRFDLMGVPSFPAAELLVFWGGVQLGFSGFVHNPAEYATHCNCPTLVMHGAEDRHARLAEGEAIYQNLPGNKKLKIFAGIGHATLLAEAPEEWKAVIDEFLAAQANRERSQD